MTSSPLRAGAQDCLPLAVGVIPFGLVFGVTAAASPIDDWVAAGSSVVIFAGASQLSLIELLDEGAPWLVAVATALIINLRYVMWSAALAPGLAEVRWRWRIGLSYLLTDQAAVISMLAFETLSEPRDRARYYLGSALTLYVTWLAATLAGVVLGTGLPESWELRFAVPLVFLGMVFSAIKDRPGAVAAGVAALATVAFHGLPLGLSVIAGAMSGLVAGVWVRESTA